MHFREQRLKGLCNRTDISAMILLTSAERSICIFNSLTAARCRDSVE